MKYNVLLLLFLMLIACGHEAPFEFNHSEDLLTILQAFLQEETEVIDMTQGGNVEQLLLQGWSFPEDTHIWGLGPKSRLQFYHYGADADVDLELVCWTLPSPGGQKHQKLEMSLNGTPIASLLVQPERENLLSVRLPAATLHVGLNILEFSYLYSVNPRTLDPNAKDERELSVSFKKIRFSSPDRGALQFLDQQHLLQKSGTPCELLAELPELVEFDLEYQSLNGVSSTIEVLDREGATVTHITLPAKKQTLKTRIRLPEPGLYKIQLLSNGATESYTVWKQAKINYYQEHAADERENEEQGFIKAAKPDILLYIVDTLRADHVSAYGYHRKTTPNFDRFADENTLFQNAYSSSSWTRPSGATLVSGLLPSNHKTIERDDALSENIVTLAEVLRENGYHTAAFSANGNITPDFGFQQGFDLFKVFYPSHPVTTHTPSKLVNDAVFSFLDTYMQQEERQPVFLLVWTVDPHGPYVPLEDFQALFSIEKHERTECHDPQFIQKIRTGKIRLNVSQKEFVRTRYDQEIYLNDSSFGDLLEKMKRLGMYDDAFILFTSDHGEEFFDHGGVGHGMTLYNEQIRIPLAVKSPFLPPGEYRQRVQLSDIYPSILDMIGANAPSYELDGRSWLRSSAEEIERTLFFDTSFGGNTLAAVLDDEKKLILNQRAYRPPENKTLPHLESFALNDLAEAHALNFSGLRDEFRLQQLRSYLSGEDSINVEQQKVDMTPELDQKLRDLGYVK